MKDVKVDTDCEERERKHLWAGVIAMRTAVALLVKAAGVSSDEMREGWEQPQALSSAELQILEACCALEESRYLVSIVTEAIDSLNQTIGV